MATRNKKKSTSKEEWAVVGNVDGQHGAGVLKENKNGDRKMPDGTIVRKKDTRVRQQKFETSGKTRDAGNLSRVNNYAASGRPAGDVWSSGAALHRYPNTSMSYDEMRETDDLLQYRGDFDHDSPGDRYTRHVWEKNADKFDDEDFARKVAEKATKIEWSKNPEKALEKAKRSYDSRGSKALSNG